MNIDTFLKYLKSSFAARSLIVSSQRLQFFDKRMVGVMSDPLTRGLHWLSIYLSRAGVTNKHATVSKLWCSIMNFGPECFVMGQHTKWYWRNSKSTHLRRCQIAKTRVSTLHTLNWSLQNWDKIKFLTRYLGTDLL